VVCVGESLTVPEACELVIRVRVDDPAVAVIVTELASTARHVKVTLCPGLTELLLAVKTMLGGLFASPEQAESPHKAIGTINQIIQRQLLFVIALYA
jgi:hypothetical protein